MAHKHKWHWKGGRLVNESGDSISIAMAYHMTRNNHEIAVACREVLKPYIKWEDELYREERKCLKQQI